MLRGIIGCEESQTVCKAFRALGHEVYSCDLQPCSGGEPQWHIQDDILNHLNDGWDFAIFHPDCTFLTVSGNKWFTPQPNRVSGKLVGQDRVDARDKAVEFFMKLINAPIQHIAVENPIGVMSTLYRKPDQIINPFQFGHPEPKKTCLWLKNLPLLTPTKIVEPEWFTTKSGKRMPTWSHKPSPSPERQKMRSVTFQGIADAMAKQYSEYLINYYETPQ
jgi:hypothetical protein